MTEFIKLHLCDVLGTPIVINVDRILWVRKNGALKNSIISVGADHQLEVKESPKDIEKVLEDMAYIASVKRVKKRLK